VPTRDPYLDAANRLTVGDPDSTFTYSTNVVVTDKGLSNRYIAKAGN